MAEEIKYPLSLPAGRRRVCDLPLEDQPGFRFKVAGPRQLSAAELLALLLGTVDALDLARDILVHHGSLHDIGRCSLAQLMQVPGVGPALAMRIRAAAELGRRMAARAPEELPRITCPADAASILAPEMEDLEQERLVLLLLDGRNQVIAMPTVYIGNVSSAIIRLAELFREALLYNASGMIVAHNHPSGESEPSPEDVRLTRQIVEAGRMMDVQIVDHIIIGRGGSHTSLKEKNLGF